MFDVKPDKEKPNSRVTEECEGTIKTSNMADHFVFTADYFKLAIQLEVQSSEM